MLRLPLEDMEMKLYYDDKTRREEIYELYQMIFEDPEEFAQYYFDEMYPQNRCLLLEHEGRIGAMLHQNPYQVLIGKKEFTLSYIVAVATREEMRRQGCMRKLLQRTFEDLAERGEPFTYLMPAKKEYYEPFDFTFIMDWYFYETRKQSDEIDFFEIQFLKEEMFDSIAQEMNEARAEVAELFTKIDEKVLRRLREEYICGDGQIFAVRREGKIVATGMYLVEEDRIQISNLLIREKKKKQEVLHFLQQVFCNKSSDMPQFFSGSDWPVRDTIEWISYDKNLMPSSVKKKPMIMARILRVDVLLPLIKSCIEQSFVIQIMDRYLDYNDGCFLWKMDSSGSTIERIEREPDIGITIADLAKVVFGYEKSEQKYLQNIISLAPVYITEII